MRRDVSTFKALQQGFTLVACLMALQAAAQVQLSPQERLDAIRQSLVDASLETPTKVSTTTWIDGQGSLQESSSFKNGMEVRGVRVLAYGRDENGQPKAKLQYPTVLTPQLDAPKPGVLKNALKKISNVIDNANHIVKDLAPKGLMTAEIAPICKVKVGAKLRHVMSFDVQAEPDLSPTLLNALRPMLQSTWIDTVSANGNVNSWRMVKGTPPPSMSQQMSAYERALTGYRPDLLPWAAKLSVRAELNEGAGWAGLNGGKGPGMVLFLEMQMTEAESQVTSYTFKAQVPVDVETPAWAAPRITMASLEQIQQVLQEIRHNAEEWLQCQPINPQVTAANTQVIEINAGELAGVKKGDEWLVANPARFPTELLSKEGAPQTLLAKVQSVSAYNAQLLVLAGPAQAVQPNWRAWPADMAAHAGTQKPAPVRVVTSNKRNTNPTANTGFNDNITPF